MKSNVLNFTGVVYSGSATREKLEQRMNKCSSAEIKNYMDILDVDRSSKTGDVDKQGLVLRFCDWLENPTASGKEPKSKVAAAKRKKKREKAAMAADPNAPKKAVSAFFTLASKSARR